MPMDEAYYSLIVETCDDAIITKDLNGIVMSWNRGAKNTFGYEAKEIIGKPIALLIPAGHEDEEPNILRRLRAGEKIDHYETLRRRKDGTLINISLTVSPVRNKEGKIIGASKVARDITAQKEAERSVRVAREELAKLNEELEHRVAERTASLNDAVAQMEEFSYTVSHDLRAPLRSVGMYTQALMEDFGPALPAEAQRYLERIQASIVRLDKMVVDVLTLSRVGQDAIEPSVVEVEALLRQIVEQYPALNPPNATIEIEPLPPVMAHAASLTQVLSNLLHNAVKFVQPGTVPKIRVFAAARDGWVRINIRDNGIGIAPQLQKRLFKMFERIHPEKSYEGTGVGLAIVRRAAGRMGGHVGMESDGTHGSTFWIELPAPK
jgi:PAS domain S-box-containing protein